MKFQPSTRLGKRQKTCGTVACRRVHRARYRRAYRRRAENAESEREYESKRRKGRPKDFWKTYRVEHPAAMKRNRACARLRGKLVEAGLQRQLDIVQLFVPIDKTETIRVFATSHRSLLAECAAKRAA